MTSLQKENIDLLIKLKQVRKKYRDKLNKEMDNFWNKWAVGIGGGFFVIGLIAGKVAH